MSGETYIRTLQIPTVSVSDGKLSLDCNWTNGYGGGAEAKTMDTYWAINGRWWDHTWGTSPGESANYTCGLAEIANWGPIWTPIRSVQFSVRFVYEGWFGGWYYSPVISLVTPEPPEIKATQEDVDGTPSIKVTVTRQSSKWNCPVVQTRGSVTIDRGNGSSQLAKIEEADETWSKSWPLSQLTSGTTGEVPIRISVSAYAVGLAGNSRSATRDHYLSHPNVPVIKSVVANGDSATSTVVVGYDLRADTAHPVDSVELYRLRDSELADASAVAMVSSGWASTGSADGKSCSICDALADAKPTERGKRTWYRLKAVHGSHSTYSQPFQLPIYDAPLEVTAGGAYVASVTEADDGKSLAVEVAWRDDSIDGATAAELAEYAFMTEVSWGETPYAWQSNKGAESFDFDWECTGTDKTTRLAAINANRPSIDGNQVAAYTHVGVAYIGGMDESKTAYVRARRKWTHGNDTGYGDYSNTVAASLSAEGATVLLSAPATVLRGEGIGLTWTVGAEANQTEWLVSGIVAPTTTDMANFAKLASSDPDEANAALAALDAACVGLASGYDASGYAVIDPSVLAGANALLVKVGVTIAGMHDESAYAYVSIADAPECSLTVPASVTATPASVTVKTDVPGTVSVSVISRGMSYETPAGTRHQASGDVALAKTTGMESATLGEDGGYSLSVSLEGATLIDGGTYEVRAHVTDAVTGLVSDIATGTFGVAWAHQASAPSATVMADASALSASILLTAPEGAATTDVADVYRVTPHGADLIAEGVAFGSTVTDRYAPFCSNRSDVETAYRIATRTRDGDVAWADAAYSLRKSALRLDWDGESIELPYNLTSSESASKQFEATTMLDGSRVGSWGAGVERGGEFTTDLIRFESASQRELIEKVAAYPGPVFVRTPQGMTFSADVQIGSVEESYDNGAVAVSLSFTQIDLADAHRCAPEDVEAPDEI